MGRRGLSGEQLNQVISNTVIVLLARPDLQTEWRANLIRLLSQVREAQWEDESIFVAAVLNLLHHPEDTMPTGTRYDRAWESILTGVQTGVLHSAQQEEEEEITLERLLSSVTQAVITVITRSDADKSAVEGELRDMRAAAATASAEELAIWLDDVLLVLGGTPINEVGQRHTGIYAAYWQVLSENLDQNQGD